MGRDRTFDHPLPELCLWCRYLGRDTEPFLRVFWRSGLSEAAIHVAAAEASRQTRLLIQGEIVADRYAVQPVSFPASGSPRLLSVETEAGGRWSQCNVEIPVDWAMSVAAEVLGERWMESKTVPVDHFVWATLWFGPFCDRTCLMGDTEMCMSSWSGPLSEATVPIARGMPAEEILLAFVLWSMRDDPVIRRWVESISPDERSVRRQQVAARVAAWACSKLSEAVERARAEIEIELLAGGG